MIAAAARHGGDFNPEQFKKVQAAREVSGCVQVPARHAS